MPTHIPWATPNLLLSVVTLRFDGSGTSYHPVVALVAWGDLSIRRFVEPRIPKRNGHNVVRTRFEFGSAIYYLSCKGANAYSATKTGGPPPFLSPTFHIPSCAHCFTGIFGSRGSGT